MTTPPSVRCAVYTRKSSERRVSNSPSIPCTPSVKPARPTSSVSAMKVGG
jgi:hypothetical protein